MRKFSGLLSAASVAMALASYADATTLIGDSVDAQYVTVGEPSSGPSPPSPIDLGTAVVGAETPTYPDVLGGGNLDINITGSQIVFTWLRTSDTETFTGPDAFNGVVFTDLTHPFLSAVLDAVSNTPGAVVSISDGNLYVDVNGVSYTNGGNVTVDVTTVPEPSTWAMMLIGFAGLGFAGYIHSRRRLPRNVIRLSV